MRRFKVGDFVVDTNTERDIARVSRIDRLGEGDYALCGVWWSMDIKEWYGSGSGSPQQALRLRKHWARHATPEEILVFRCWEEQERLNRG